MITLTSPTLDREKWGFYEYYNIIFYSEEKITDMIEQPQCGFVGVCFYLSFFFGYCSEIKILGT